MTVTVTVEAPKDKVVPGSVTVTLPSVTVTVWFLYKTAEWMSVVTVPSVTVTVSVWFLYTTAE